MKIIVNAREIKYNKRTISYDTVVKFSGRNPDLVYSVTYSSPKTISIPSHIHGSLIKGETANVVDGMIFNISMTNNS